MLFGEQIGANTPWWVAGAMSLIGVGYALFRLYYWYMHKSLKHDEEVQESVRKQKAEARREAANEAWEVVDRLSAEVEATTKKVEAIEDRTQRLVDEANERERIAMERAGKCEQDHARTMGRLSIIEAWARQKGLRIPPQESGSTGHTAIPPPSPPPRPPQSPTQG